MTLFLLVLAVGVVLWSHNRPVQPVSVVAQAPVGEKPVSKPVKERTKPKAVDPAVTPVETPVSNGLNSIAYLEQPKLSDSERVFYNTTGRYSYVYAPEHRQSRWVAYKLTRDDIGGVGRSGSFKVDSMITACGWVCATNQDYRQSGYDRGHLLPSGDRTRTVEENRSTFLFSNVSPQHPRLNQRIWKDLEERLRRQTSQYDTLYIVTGGVLEDSAGYPVIGSGVSVPELFYKVIAGRKNDAFELDAYVMPNAAENAGSFGAHRVSVDSVERLTGLEFFPLIHAKRD